jgi:conserved oligomeric Golgi complex subunit 5
MDKGGENYLEPTTNIKEDPLFTPFCGVDFDPATFASRALAETASTPAAQIELLQSGILTLETRLRKEVLRCHDDLIAQATWVGEAETSIQRIALSVRSLQNLSSRIRGDIVDPFQDISGKSQQLKHVQTTVDILRHLIHRLRLVQRLQTQIASGGSGILELAKSAKLIAEIQRCDDEVDLSGIALVDASASFLKQATARIQTQAQTALHDGLNSLSQADVGSALQIFYNLEQLPAAASLVTTDLAKNCESAFAAALDSRKLATKTGSAGGGGGGVLTSGSLILAMWTQLAQAMDVLRTAAAQVWHMQRVLAKKKDPLTHSVFLDTILAAPFTTTKQQKEQPMLPLDSFWSAVSGAVGKCFSSAFTAPRGGSGFTIREALVNSYPKLATLLDETSVRISKEASSKDAIVAMTEAQKSILLNIASDFQNSYLTATSTRLREALVSAFPGGSRALPTAADLQRAIARMHEELKAASSSSALAPRVAACVGEALLLAAERAEHMAASGPDLRAVRGTINSAQLKNISICNYLQEMHRSMLNLIQRLPDAAVLVLSAPIQAVEAAAIDMVLPTFKAIVEMAEQEILTMHSLQWSGTAAGEADKDNNNQAVAQSSPYVKAMAKHLAHCRIEWLSKFTPPPTSGSQSIGRRLVERLVYRMLGFFVRHAALIRPLNQAGKLQLAKDAADIEEAVATSLLLPDAVPVAYQGLGAFRRLLFTETSALLQQLQQQKEGQGSSSGVLRDLPTGVVLHHLFSRVSTFSFASPHTRKSLSPGQYSLWLDQHSDEETMKFIKSAVDVKVEGEGEDVAVIALMKKMCVSV